MVILDPKYHRVNALYSTRLDITSIYLTHGQIVEIIVLEDIVELSNVAMFSRHLRES